MQSAPFTALLSVLENLMQNAAEMLTDSLHDTAVYSSMNTSADSPESFCKLDGKKTCTQNNIMGGFTQKRMLNDKCCILLSS